MRAKGVGSIVASMRLTFDGGAVCVERPGQTWPNTQNSMSRGCFARVADDDAPRFWSSILRRPRNSSLFKLGISKAISPTKAIVPIHRNIQPSFVRRTSPTRVAVLYGLAVQRHGLGGEKTFGRRLDVARSCRKYRKVSNGAKDRQCTHHLD